MSMLKVQYAVAYSKTDRSSCKKCKAGIKKDACRMEKRSPSRFHDGFESAYFHVACFFVKEKGKLTSSDQLKGFEDLRTDDQAHIAGLIQQGLPAGFVAAEGGADAKSSSISGAGSAGMDEESEKMAAENNKRLWELKDKFEAKDNEVTNKTLKGLLEWNGMPSTGGRQDLVNRVSDAMLFGVATCPVCLQKDMSFAMGQYVCKAETTFGLCAFKGLGKDVGGKVSVAPFLIDLNCDVPWIRAWKQEISLKRQVRVVTREAVKEYVRDAAQPLRSMKFSAIGNLEREKEALQDLIVNNGGSFTDDIHADIDYVLTTYEDFLRAQSDTLPSNLALPSELIAIQTASENTSPNTSGIATPMASTASETMKSKSKQQILEEKRELQKKNRDKLRHAINLRLALVTEPLLDQLLVQFGFDQSIYLLHGNLPPIAHAKLATPASVFPNPSDTKLAPSSLSLLDEIEMADKKSSEEAEPKKEEPKAKPSGPFWAKKPTTSAPMSKRGIVDTEAKCPEGVVYKELKPKKDADRKDAEEEKKFDATSFDSLKDPVVEKDEYELYDRMLSFADVTSGLNKWYRLQLIDVKGNGKSYTLFTRWGRVGEPGNWTKTPDSGLATAKAAWEKKWMEKTKNEWKNREQFVKLPGAYSPVDVDEDDGGDDGDKEKKNLDGDGAAGEENMDSDLIPPSYLDPRLKALMDMIFDKNMLVQSMADLKIDVKKMPLGKLNRNTLLKGYSVLKEIETALLSTDETARFKLPSLSSQFYTLIAHDFGRNPPEIIDNFATLRLKMRQLETLLDILVAAQLLSEKEPLVQENPADLNYKHMKVELKPVSSYTRDYKMIQRFVESGYNPKTLGKKLSLMDLFKVEREGEKESFEPFRNQRPRKLLWHASRICNFVGILSSGLRIAPPEAPATGYLFGKAIYLSDLIEKSAPYCYPDPETGLGLLVLCDVALGESLLLNKAEYITKLPEGKQSAKALAKFQPDPSKEELGDDKVFVPIGAPTPTNLPDVFLEHSEYMVYDASQVRIRYLVQVRFSKEGTLIAPKDDFKGDIGLAIGSPTFSIALTCVNTTFGALDRKMAKYLAKTVEEDTQLKQVLSQLQFDSNSPIDDSPPSTYSSSLNSEVNLAYSSSWVDLYRRYRRPLSSTSWKWTQKDRPGKFCDAHLLDYFSCIDGTKDKLGPDDPPEKYCLADRELTTACMAHTLCENKIFAVTDYCLEEGNPNDRSYDCWTKIWLAQTCVQHSQILLSKRFWASRPELMSTTERYMLLLGAPTTPGKRATSDDYILRRKDFLERSLDRSRTYAPGDHPYVAP